jgi:hypothetical protein
MRAMLAAMTTGDDEQASADTSGLEVRVLEARAVDEMVAKIIAASSAPRAAESVERWLAEHPTELWTARGHDHAVVGGTLMYLHDAPDGTVIPHECHPNGRERVYTDLAHAEEAYRI